VLHLHNKLYSNVGLFVQMLMYM